ncbi:MAG: hypothetical protein KDC80_01360 [Saprospiraceae bacterium]|nr:hypothetical protein [Lewinella sp.]MCB0664432.1 hypothetical protein [Saprospiraceae bacterium]
MKYQKFLVLISIIAFTHPGFAQTKYEQEIRIRQIEVPKKAGDFVDGMQLTRKIKWYKEIGHLRTSFEAKTKYKGKRLSIEFSGNGNFEDLEVEIHTNEIPPDTYKNISEYLSGTLGKYVIEKIQIQYRGDPKSIRRYTQHLGSDGDLIIHYEVEVAAKMDGSFVKFEYLFNEDGAFVKQSRIIQKVTDNIVY